MKSIETKSLFYESKHNKSHTTSLEFFEISIASIAQVQIYRSDTLSNDEQSLRKIQPKINSIPSMMMW